MLFGIDRGVVEAGGVIGAGGSALTTFALMMATIPRAGRDFAVGSCINTTAL